MKISKKRIIFISSAVVLIIAGLLIFFFLRQNTNYDFRKAKWGMSKDQVRQSETLKLQEESDTVIAYSVTDFGSYKVSPCYSFDKYGNLESAAYLYCGNTNFSNVSFEEAKAYYKNFIDIATKYYGKSKKSDVNEHYDSTVWETSNTKITVQISDLMGNNQLSVTYQKK
jgi:hypothetical protein